MGVPTGLLFLDLRFQLFSLRVFVMYRFFIIVVVSALTFIRLPVASAQPPADQEQRPAFATAPPSAIPPSVSVIAGDPPLVPGVSPPSVLDSDSVHVISDSPPSLIPSPSQPIPLSSVSGSSDEPSSVTPIPSDLSSLLGVAPVPVSLTLPSSDPAPSLLDPVLVSPNPPLPIGVVPAPPGVLPFDGGSPQAYAALAKAIEESLIAFSRSTAESQARAERGFGSLGLDFSDSSQRYEARVKLQRDLSLLQFYSSAAKTLGDAVTAESTFRSAQVSAHINSVQDLGRTRAALAQLASLAPGATPDSPYALVSLEPASIVLTRASRVHAITVRSHASGVVVRDTSLAIASDHASFPVDASSCSGIVLAIGESCVLLVASPRFPVDVPVPSGVLRVAVSVDGSPSALAQQIPVSISPLEVPPAVDDRLRVVEAAGPEIQKRNDDRMEHLAKGLVAVIDERLTTFETAVQTVHDADESARRQITLEAQHSTKEREVLSLAFSAQLALAADARDALQSALTDISSALTDAEAARLTDRASDREARDSLAQVVSNLTEQIQSGVLALPGSGIDQSVYTELTARVHDLETMVLLGVSPSGVSSSSDVPHVAFPLVDRIHILSLFGDEASLYIEGAVPGASPVRVTIRPGQPLPQPGWTLHAVHPASGRIDIASPSGQTISVYPRSHVSSSSAHDSGDHQMSTVPLVGISQVLRPGM